MGSHIRRSQNSHNCASVYFQVKFSLPFPSSVPRTLIIQTGQQAKVSNEVTNGKCQSGTLIKGNQKCQSLQSYNQSSYQLLFDDLTSTRNGDAESFLLQNHSWQSSYRIFRPYSKRDEVITKYFLQRS